MSLETNRDLYLAILKFLETNPNTERSLEEYLEVLLNLGDKFQHEIYLSLNAFFSLLCDALVVEVQPSASAWQSRDPSTEDNLSGYEIWRAVISRQILDLHEMRERGILQDELRYFGVQAPSGRLWFNFDPATFLECGLAGRFGGWVEGDNSNREFVPGTVHFRNNDGELVEADPRDLPNPVYKIDLISWDTFADFLHDGQTYE